MKFDPKKIPLDTPLAQHEVYYTVYEEKEGFDNTRTYNRLNKDIKEEKIDGAGNKNGNTACFASLRNLADVNRNRLLFKAKFNLRSVKELHLTEKERRRWVNLCRYHGLMPSYVGSHFTKTGNFILKIDELSMTRTYMYLTAARFMQEYPESIRATLYFKDLGLNFLVAHLAASRCTVKNSGHSIYKGCRSYMENISDIGSMSVDFTHALALKNYIRVPHSTDEKSIPQQVKEANESGRDRYYSMKFGLQTTIDSIVLDKEWYPENVKIKKLFSKKLQHKIKTYNPDMEENVNTEKQ